MKEENEVQHAEVTIWVTIPVHKDDSEDSRKRNICRRLRFSNMDGDLKLESPLLAENVDLTRTETMEEAGIREMEEAESKALAEAERRAERHFEERAGRHLR